MPIRRVNCAAVHVPSFGDIVLGGASDDNGRGIVKISFAIEDDWIVHLVTTQNEKCLKRAIPSVQLIGNRAIIFLNDCQCQNYELLLR